MDKEKLNQLLDSIYELEGLVHLALNRDDNPEHLSELIKKKGEELSLYASHVVTRQQAHPQELPQQSAMPHGVKQMESIEETPLYVVDNFIEDDVKVSNVVEDDIKPAVDAVFSALQDPDIIDIDEENMQIPKEPRGKLVFSVNDRYLFKRELFGNSDADFNNTLSLVASMENYDEAEDYFLGEMQWDPKKQEVVDFLEIIKRYFKE